MISGTYFYNRIAPLVLALALFSQPAHALDFSKLPGTIPLNVEVATPATDLVKDGKVLFPNEVKQLATEMDISELDPKEPTDIWAKTPVPPEEKAAEDRKLDFFQDKPVEYVGDPGSPLHLFRFNAAAQTDQGITTFAFLLSKTAHNILLRKALLEKLGYRVPPVRHIPKLTVQFTTPGAREIFRNELTKTNFADPARWIIEDDDAGNRLVLRDVMVAQAQSDFYNFAFARVPYEYMRDRRTFRALAILFQMTEVPETVNGYPWNLPSIVNDFLPLTFQDKDQFFGSYEDTCWIVRKLAKLTRKDFEEIVNSTAYEEAAKHLLVEKLIAQRNSAVQMFGIQAEQLPVDYKVSFGDKLIDGKLVKEDTQNYASRFAFGDPEAPFSSGDYFAFARSKIYSNIIANLVSRFNQNVMPNTDIAAKLTAHEQDIEMKQLADLFKTGELHKIPNKLYAFPMGSMNVIVSRDIVVGSYLGSNNMIQIADAVGLNLNAGIFLHADAPAWPWTINGNATGSITRTYTHLRPIKSIKVALQYPFKNLLVPLVKTDIGETLQKVIAPDFNKLPKEDQTKVVATTVDSLKKTMDVGESLMITDTIGAQLGVNLRYGINDLTGIYPTFSAQQTIISRMHITRFDDDTFHIYLDRGEMGTLQVSLQFKAFVPIVEISGKGNKGSAKTRFRPIKITGNNDDLAENTTNLRILDEAIENFNPYAAAIDDQYFDLNYKFSQGGFGFSFLPWKWKTLSTDQTVDITVPTSSMKTYDDPSKRARTYYRTSSGKMSGTDWEDFSVDVFNASLDKLIKNNRYAVDSTNNGRPGNTIFGNSKTREAIFEAELDRYRRGISKPFVNINYYWEGWSISRKDAEKIIDDMNKKTAGQLIPFNALNTTEQIQLYNINLSYMIYAGGIEYTLALDPETVKQIFERFKTVDLVREQHYGPPSHTMSRRFYLYDVFSEHVRNALAAQASGDAKEYASEVREAMSLAETSISTPGMFALVGGEQNMAVRSQIHGFRKGDEFGNDDGYFSKMLGQFGATDLAGPWEAARSTIGESPSEFYLYWLMDRI